MNNEITEDDYAMMLKRIYFILSRDEKYKDKPLLNQARDLLKRGNKFQILRHQNSQE